MSVAGCNDGFAELFAERNYLAVEVFKILDCRSALGNEEIIITKRLNFEIVVKLGYFFDIGFAPVVNNCLVKFSRFAGGADYKTVP